MLEQIINIDSLQTPAIIGQIAGIASVIGVALFIYTTGFGWIKQATRAWRGDAVDEGFDFDELTRKIALLVLISSFTLVTGAITTVVNYARKSIEVEFTDLDAKVNSTLNMVEGYARFAYYFNLIKDYQNAPNPASKAAAKELFFKRYPDGQPKLAPVSDGVFDEIGLSISNTLIVSGTKVTMGATTIFIMIGQLLSGIFKYFFAILFQVLLAIFPLSLAFSIPKSMENSYSTSIRRILVTGMTFVVIAVLDQFVVQGFSSIIDIIANGAGNGLNSDVNKIDDAIYVALPLFSVVLIGLYASTAWIAGSVVGGGDGEGGIATKGMGMAIGVIAAGAAVALGGAKGASGASKGAGQALKASGNSKSD